MDELNKSVWDNIEGYYSPKCPKCKSTDTEGLNLYKGMFKKHISKEAMELLGLNPDELRNQQKFRCNSCGYEYWANEGVL